MAPSNRVAETRLKAYLASPYGFAASTRHFMETIYTPQISAVIDTVNPWDLTSKEEVDRADAEGTQSELAMEIGSRNRTAIDSADIVIAALDGQDVDSGTAAEVGYAFGVGKLIFGYRTDLRRSGEAGSIVNLQVEYFIKASGGTVATDLGELITLLQRHLASQAPPTRLPEL